MVTEQQVRGQPSEVQFDIAKKEKELNSLRVSLQACDRVETETATKRAQLDRDREDLLVRETLGEDVRKELGKLRKAYLELETEPDRRAILRRAIAKKESVLRTAKRHAAAQEASRLAAESVDRITKLEKDLLRVGAALEREYKNLVQIYSHALNGKVIGPGVTPKALVYRAVAQAFAWLAPVIEHPRGHGDKRPLTNFLDRIASRMPKS